MHRTVMVLSWSEAFCHVFNIGLNIGILCLDVRWKGLRINVISGGTPHCRGLGLDLSSLTKTIWNQPWRKDENHHSTYLRLPIPKIGPKGYHGWRCQKRWEVQEGSDSTIFILSPLNFIDKCDQCHFSIVSWPELRLKRVQIIQSHSLHEREDISSVVQLPLAGNCWCSHGEKP